MSTSRFFSRHATASPSGRTLMPRLLAVLVVAGLGCKPHHPNPPITGSDAALCQLVQPTQVARSCPSDQAVGPCERNPNGWMEQSKPLWEPEQNNIDKTNETSQDVYSLPPKGYCKYVRKPKTDPPATLPSGFIPDCPVLTLGGGGAATLSAPQQEHQDVFDVGIGKPTGAVNNFPKSTTVTVAIIDFFPTSAGTDSEISHGEMVEAAARRAADCDPSPTASCESRIFKRYVLAPGARASDVAVQIERAVGDWMPDRRNGEKLIINLSLGWEVDPRYETMSKLVRSRIAWARCQGALVLAASGNRSIHDCSEAPIEPAVWERLDPPTRAECTNLQAPLPSVDLEVAPGTYAPLLHSITPIKGDAELLLSHRPGSTSRIAAAGGGVFSGGRAYGPIWGSSVATAVTSGIAALVWAHTEYASGDELMEEIWGAGNPTSHTVQVYNGAEPREQRWIRACEALEPLCPAGSNCPFACPTRELENPTAPLLDASTGAHFGPVDVKSTKIIECPSCEGNPIRVKASRISDSSLVPDPEVHPQPSKLICPSCHIELQSRTGLAVLQLDESYANTTAEGVQITLYNEDGSAEEAHYYDDDEMLRQLTTITSDGSMAVISLEDPALAEVGGAPPSRAWVDVFYRKSSSSPTVQTAGNELPVYTDST